MLAVCVDIVNYAVGSVQRPCRDRRPGARSSEASAAYTTRIRADNAHTQSSIGVLFKASQSNGHYAFSQASSLTLTELIKFLISLLFYRTELKARRSEAQISLREDSRSPRRSESSEDEEALLKEANDYGVKHNEGSVPLTVGSGLPVPEDGSLRAIFACWKREINQGIVIGFAGLALLCEVHHFGDIHATDL